MSNVDITLGMPVGWLEDDPRITRQPCAPRVMRCHRCCYTHGPWHQLAPELFICVPCYQEFITPIAPRIMPTETRGDRFSHPLRHFDRTCPACLNPLSDDYDKTEAQDLKENG